MSDRWKGSDLGWCCRQCGMLTWYREKETIWHMLSAPESVLLLQGEGREGGGLRGDLRLPTERQVAQFEDAMRGGGGEESQTMMFVAEEGGGLVGAICVKDQIRSDARYTVQRYATHHFAHHFRWL